jgi:hypothetical protein
MGKSIFAGCGAGAPGWALESVSLSRKSEGQIRFRFADFRVRVRLRQNAKNAIREKAGREMEWLRSGRLG